MIILLIFHYLIFFIILYFNYEAQKIYQNNLKRYFFFILNLKYFENASVFFTFFSFFNIILDNAVVDAIKLILLIFNNFSIVKKVVNKIERVK